MTKEIKLVEKVDNRDGTISMIAELCVYIDGVFSQHLSRSPFTFADNLSDQEIIDQLQNGDYKMYF